MLPTCRIHCAVFDNDGSPVAVSNAGKDAVGSQRHTQDFRRVVKDAQGGGRARAESGGVQLAHHIGGALVHLPEQAQGVDAVAVSQQGG